jgi:hypothetical protein
MEAQFGIILVLVVALISALFVKSTRTTKSSRAGLEAPTQADHDEQTRIMAKRLAETGTEWRVAQQEDGGNSDVDDPVDQSVEAQSGRLDRW